MNNFLSKIMKILINSALALFMTAVLVAIIYIFLMIFSDMMIAILMFLKIHWAFAILGCVIFLYLFCILYFDSGEK